MLANWWIAARRRSDRRSVAGGARRARVPMTAMPQMVAIFNGAGGGAAALVAVAEFLRDAGSHAGELLPLAVHRRHAARRDHRRRQPDRLGHRLRQAPGRHRRATGAAIPAQQIDHTASCSLAARRHRRLPGARVSQRVPLFLLFVGLALVLGVAAGHADRRRRHAGRRSACSTRTPASRWRPPASC